MINIKTHEKTELVLGLVCPVGIDQTAILLELFEILQDYDYDINDVKISDLVKEFFDLGDLIKDYPEYERVQSRINACNNLRRVAHEEIRRSAAQPEKVDRDAGYDIAIVNGVLSIYEAREFESDKDSLKGPLYGKAHIFRTIKHPEEYKTLRDIYGDGFYLLGFNATVQSRIDFLVSKCMSEHQAKELMQLDSREAAEFGQKTSDVFQYSDVFINMDPESSKWKDELRRFINLIFGVPLEEPPRRDEYAMFLAFAASMRSGDLSRQVGSVITTPDGDVISTGTNDAPKAHGGQYWSDDKESDHRDYKRGFDANEVEKRKMISEISNRIENVIEELSESGFETGDLSNAISESLKSTSINDLTEFGRAVHAEMEALLACSRTGKSPRGCYLYCTTFPCHNCAKHIVAAGIEKVFFIEPYPKSKAFLLHSDSITPSSYSLDNIVEAEKENDTSKSSQIEFIPFDGIGPWRFLDFFAMKNSRGRPISKKDKNSGMKIEVDKSTLRPRIPMLPGHYINREFDYIERRDEVVELMFTPEDSSGEKNG